MTRMASRRYRGFGLLGRRLRRLVLVTYIGEGKVQGLSLVRAGEACHGCVMTVPSQATPLMIASRKGHVEVVRSIFARPFSSNIVFRVLTKIAVVCTSCRVS